MKVAAIMNTLQSKRKLLFGAFIAAMLYSFARSARY